ncbi:MAG: BolA/IbaG family iron-sulfur metabolism protein [Nevskiaceae bacterium]|nr:MAG: BolA/IbaG family iron-sulfur metabolism protein [Nevskiaceae bacterium]TBR73352.1 MAG: BolA/IbaG family iron-sulfur metabolism protein [Nevskiaceae bacterium]
MTADEIRALIEAHLPGAEVAVETGDNVHFAADVAWAGFADRKLIEQHRLVNAALGDRLGAEVHALSLRTRVP